jgi:3-oxoacyl-[acyl-carrier protein] reductase
MNIGLEGKVFFVTGAANGIGAAATNILAQSGAMVAACDIDKVQLDARWKDEVKNKKILTIKADISNQEDVQNAISKCNRVFGRIDAVLHFAAILDSHTIDELTPNIWDSVMAVNLRGTYLVASAALPYMRIQGGGRIVFTASDSARMGSLVSGPAYAASKGGVIALTKTLALYTGKDNITVNAVCPGLTMTGMSTGWTPSFIEAIVKRTPLGRLAEPEDIAKVAIFLASDAAGFMTGEIVEVNGGIHFD